MTGASTPVSGPSSTESSGSTVVVVVVVVVVVDDVVVDVVDVVDVVVVVVVVVAGSPSESDSEQPAAQVTRRLVAVASQIPRVLAFAPCGRGRFVPGSGCIRWFISIPLFLRGLTSKRPIVGERRTTSGPE
jgi:hypothetical protein